MHVSFLSAMVSYPEGPGIEKNWSRPSGLKISSDRSWIEICRSSTSLGPYPQYGWDFPEEIPEKFRKDTGNALRAFPGISLESTAGMPQTLQFKAFEASRAFPEFSPPPSTAGDASFFRIGSGERLSELVMEFPAVLGVFLISVTPGGPRKWKHRGIEIFDRDSRSKISSHPDLQRLLLWNKTRETTPPPPKKKNLFAEPLRS